MDFVRFTEHYEQPLNDVSTNPLFHAVAFNKHFETVIVRSMKWTGDASFSGKSQLLSSSPIPPMWYPFSSLTSPSPSCLLACGLRDSQKKWHVVRLRVGLPLQHKRGG